MAADLATLNRRRKEIPLDRLPFLEELLRRKGIELTPKLDAYVGRLRTPTLGVRLEEHPTFIDRVTRMPREAAFRWASHLKPILVPCVGIAVALFGAVRSVARLRAMRWRPSRVQAIALWATASPIMIDYAYPPTNLMMKGSDESSWEQVPLDIESEFQKIGYKVGRPQFRFDLANWASGHFRETVSNRRLAVECVLLSAGGLGLGLALQKNRVLL